MTHFQEMLVRHETEILRILKTQILDAQDKHFGAFMEADGHIDTRHCGFLLSHLAVGYLIPQCRYYHDASLKTAIENSFCFLFSHHRPSGCLDLTSCNFDSAPDTAFTMNSMINAWWLLEKDSNDEVQWLRSPMKKLIEICCEGVMNGGFHTPNHRWAISACLKHAALICGRDDFSRKADLYLGEGLDIDENGEFAERSTGTYNAVNDDQMIRLYLATGNMMYLKAARSNLEMMLSYLDPDGSVFTFNSTRQDYGQKVWPDQYYILFLLVGFLMDDPKFAAYSEFMWEMSTAHGITPSGLAWLVRFPDLEAFGKQVPADLCPISRYSHVYSASGIGRWKRGSLSVTAMAYKPNFLYVQNDSMNLCVSLYGNVCDKRNFVADRIEPTEDGCRLSCRLDSWYYLPFEGNGPDTSDWWKMDNALTRQKQIRAFLDLSVQIHVAENAVSLIFSAEGLDCVPLRLELGFTPGTLRGEQFLMDAFPGGEMTVSGGAIEISDHSGHCLTVSPCFASHNVRNRMIGAYPKAEDRFTVYLTCTSPCTRQITIGTTPMFPSSLS
ncbi:MAG: hypothetical protein K6A68_12435 [Clostridiales bacterium]|nr:hypothetical protein [Clostridiales bacterium]